MSGALWAPSKPGHWLSVTPALFNRKIWFSMTSSAGTISENHILFARTQNTSGITSATRRGMKWLSSKSSILMRRLMQSVSWHYFWWIDAILMTESGLTICHSLRAFKLWKSWTSGWKRKRGSKSDGFWPSKITWLKIILLWAASLLDTIIVMKSETSEEAPSYILWVACCRFAVKYQSHVLETRHNTLQSNTASTT